MKTTPATWIAIATVFALSIWTGAANAGDGHNNHHANHHNNHNQYHGSYYHGGGYNHHGYGHRGYYVRPHYGYGYGYGSQAGVLRGVASVIDAQGRFNLNTALAAGFLEDARSKNFDNQVKKAETFFAKRAINKAARTTESKEETAAKVRRISEASKPNRLGPTMFRPDLGLLNWPTMLRRPEFQSLRHGVDSMLATGPQAMVRYGSEIDGKAKLMREAMKTLVREVSPHEYAAARQFLLSLRYESQLALRTNGASLMPAEQLAMAR